MRPQLSIPGAKSKDRMEGAGSRIGLPAFWAFLLGVLLAWPGLTAAAETRGPGACGSSSTAVRSLNAPARFTDGKGGADKGQPPFAQPDPTPCTVPFTDVPSSNVYYPYIKCLYCRGIMTGYNTGCATGSPCFRPNNNIMRGPFALYLNNATGLADPVTTTHYQDVNPSHNFYVFIERMTIHGYVSGFPCGSAGEPCVAPGNLPYFRPSDDVTRGVAAKAVSMAAGFSEAPGPRIYQDIAENNPLFPYVQRVTHHSVMSGYPCNNLFGPPCVPPNNAPYFKPSNPVTRGETAKVLSLAFFPQCNLP